LTVTGTAVGMVFLWLSLTPSLLPRGPMFQGIVSGAAGAIGYAIGVFAVVALAVAFASATQDIVIDAYRIESAEIRL
jgi:uncharacterized membrane protein